MFLSLIHIYPLTATAEKLAEYGFPERPADDDTERLAAWKERMAAYSGFSSAEPEISVGLASNTPVSYTHLDVYKRQCLWCCRHYSKRKFS